MKRKRSFVETPQQIVSTDLYLDDYCWEHVFKFIFNNHDDDDDENRCYFKTLSLVNKQFLSITNHLRLSLTVWNPTCRLLSRLFPRFVNLISLDLSHYRGVINNLLVQISRYQLKLTSLNLSNQPNIPARGLRAFSRNTTTLTSLICSNIASVSVADLVLISSCFPLLQELDLSKSINFKIDDGMSMVFDMSMVFPKLRKVNLYSRTHTYINDAWLLQFFKNSKFLEDVVMLRCPFVTHHGIASAIRERPTLKSLSITCMLSNANITSHLIDSLLSLKDLTCLDLSCSRISDELLSSIATRGLPLKKLALLCRGYSYAGIFCLVSKCQCIQHLNLQGADFLNDQDVMKLSLFFGHLKSINLCSCNMLTESTLFSLVRNSPLLNEIKMEYTSIGREDVVNFNSFQNFVVSPQLKSLHLGNNSELRDESIKMLASIFPNLEVLGLTDCYKISGEGIYQVLKRCCNIRDLNLDGCLQVKLHEMNIEVPKLKVLNLSSTRVDDKTLYVISKSCYGLLKLVLRRCDGVTKEGIMHVVNHCTELRKINLAYCPKLLPNIVNEMVFSRPSLRKITFQPCSQISANKRKLFSHYGCLLC